MPELNRCVFESFHSLLAIARTVRDLSCNWDADEKVALAWTLRNRLTGCAAPTADQVPIHETESSLDDPALAEAMALVVAVWLGEVPDPTNGATACHRHDLLPAWARFRKVKALIGEQLFY